MNTKSVDLFTIEEHVVIAECLGVKPYSRAKEFPTIYEALEELGFEGRASMRSEEDAALASIVLERIQDRLPQWAAVRHNESGEADVLLAREIKDRRANRKIEMIPQHLLTINWADSGPGFSWPVAYHVTWLPYYDVHVVTQSADSPDAFGYCDFAIGHFSGSADLIGKAAEIIKDDWEWAKDTWDQQRWAYLFDTGLIDNVMAEKLAEDVWGDEQDHFCSSSLIGS